MKPALRKKFLALRRQQTEEQLRSSSAQIFGHWRDEFASRGFASLHLFRSVVSKGELDTSPFTRWARQQTPPVTVVSPRVVKGSPHLAHHSCSDNELVTSPWGIPEPPPTAELFPAEQLVHVLVPMLAFDLEGHRLGYGGGYYDRFLAKTKKECLKVGLCLELGRVPEGLPREPFDIALDAVVTERGVHWFSL